MAPLSFRRLTHQPIEIASRVSRQYYSQQCKAINLRDLLSRPTWSVRSLLPPSPDSGSAQESDSISPKQLHHLLGLSALPRPKTQEEESRMIQVLQSQLHFVRDIQSVNTAGVAPLSSIRDETATGRAEATIGVLQLQEELSQESQSGRSRRPRRSRPQAEDHRIDEWDVFQAAPQKAGKYFVARGTEAQ